MTSLPQPAMAAWDLIHNLLVFVYANLVKKRHWVFKHPELASLHAEKKGAASKQLPGWVAGLRLTRTTWPSPQDRSLVRLSKRNAEDPASASRLAAPPGQNGSPFLEELSWAPNVWSRASEPLRSWAAGLRCAAAIWQNRIFSWIG